jgi:rare lipoprotein A (peptidoglycan hydrolase)
MLQQMKKPKNILYVLGICTLFLVSWNMPTTLEGNHRIIKVTILEDVYEGTASYYHNKFHGKKTASGEKYDKRAYTAAVRMNEINVPFGTIIEVKNIQNNKTVQVKVNDKMPNKSSSIVDLSRVAAEEIGLIQAGRAKVEVRVIAKE